MKLVLFWMYRFKGMFGDVWGCANWEYLVVLLGEEKSNE